MSKIETMEQLIAKYPEAYKNAKIQINKEKKEEIEARMKIARSMANTINQPYCEINKSVKNPMCSNTPPPQNAKELEESVNLLVRAAESTTRW